MPRGGSRPGAGRPRKAVTETEKRVDAAKVAIIAAKSAPKPVTAATPAPAPEVETDGAKVEQITPLEFLLEMVNDLTSSKADRFRAAVAAAPYVHGKAADAAPGKKEEKQAEAEKAATGRFAPRQKPRLVVGNG